MGDYIIIKVGRNEPGTYVKANRLSSNMDVIDMLIDYPGEQGVGTQTDKVYFTVPIDFGGLTTEQKWAIHAEILRQWVCQPPIMTPLYLEDIDITYPGYSPLNCDDSDLPPGKPCLYRKRLYYFNIDDYPDIPQNIKVKIGKFAADRENKKFFDLLEEGINQFDLTTAWVDCREYFLRKNDEATSVYDVLGF
jgi:hypothetical protein